MEADYLELRDKRKVRIEINLTSLSAWSLDTGANLQNLKDLQKDIGLMLSLAWCGAKEGERIENRDLALDKHDFGAQCGIREITAIVAILGRQLKLTEIGDADKKK